MPDAFPATTLPIYPGLGQAPKYAGLHTQWLGYVLYYSNPLILISCIKATTTSILMAIFQKNPGWMVVPVPLSVVLHLFWRQRLCHPTNSIKALKETL